jgi:hypothetical protein
MTGIERGGGAAMTGSSQSARGPRPRAGGLLARRVINVETVAAAPFVDDDLQDADGPARGSGRLRGPGTTPPPRMDIDAARREALFVSSLQCSQHADAAQVRDAVMHTIRRLGVRTCSARVAQEFGDHPEIAVARMRWVIEAVSQAYASPGRTLSWVLPPAGRPQVVAA